MRAKDELRLALFALLLMLGSMLAAAVARATALPADQWDRDTHGWLSRGVVGEAGWVSEDDHISIAYVLRRRWLMWRNHSPTARFLTMARQYMKGTSVNRVRLTSRLVWVRSLPFVGLQKPDGWDEGTNGSPWSRYAPRWSRVRERMQKWQDGAYTDRCPEAEHWGAPNGIDLIRATAAGWREVDCGDTKNIFYSTGALDEI